MPEIIVTGLVELERALNELPENLARTALRTASRKAAQLLQRSAQANAPIHAGPYPPSRRDRSPGNLRAGIVVTTKIKGEGVRGASISTNIGLRVSPASKSVWYGRIIETGRGIGRLRVSRKSRGTRGDTRKRVPPRPFLGPAFTANVNRMIDVFKEELGQAIERIKVKLGEAA